MHFTPHPLLRFLLPLIAGIAVGECFLQAYAEWSVYFFIVAICCFSLLLFPFLHRYSTKNHLVKEALLFISLTLAAISLTLANHVRYTQVWSSHAQSYRAIVSEIPRPTPKGYSLRLRLLSGSHRGNSVQLYFLRPDTTHLTANSTPRLGDELLLRTQIFGMNRHLNPGETDYSTLLLRQGITGQGIVFANNWRIVHHHGNNISWRSLFDKSTPLTFTEKLRQLRESLLHQYSHHLSKHTTSIIAAMSLGEKSLLSPTQRQLYALTGTSHVLALSGLHLAILYFLLNSILLTPIRRRSRPLYIVLSLVTLILLWTFALLAALPISLVRACCMFSIAHVLTLFAHRPSPFHSLILTTLILLTLRPLWLFDIGFQLSVLSVLGILLGTHLFPVPQAWSLSHDRDIAKHVDLHRAKHQKLYHSLFRLLWSTLVVSISAQVATLPLVAYYFHSIPLLSLVSNLVAIPMTYTLLTLSLVFLLFPPLQATLAFLLEHTLRLGEFLLSALLTLPHSTLSLRPSLLLVAFCYLSLVFWIFLRIQRQKLTKLWIFSALCVSASIVLMIGLWDRWQQQQYTAETRVYHCWGNTAIHFIAADGRSWLLCSDSAAVLKQLSATRTNDWQTKSLSPTLLSLATLQSPDAQRLLTASALQAQTRSSTSSTLPIGFAPHLLHFGHQRWAIVSSRLSKAFPRQALRVDFLFLARGCNRPLAHILRFYHPRHLLLGTSLSDFYRRQYLRQAQALRLTTVDCANSDALRIPYE